MNVDGLLQAIEQTAIAGAIGGSSASQWLFPIVETCHVISIAAVFGSILMVDLRLVGLIFRDSGVSSLSGELLPFTWIAFACAATTGGLLFSSKALEYFHNTQF